MPPRHGKSELASKWTPIWFLANWPNKRVILSSYEATFAASWGRKVRNTMQENPGIGVQLSEDSKAVGVWETTQGGGMLAVGAGGAITGHGADLLVIDDPVKNAEEAASPVIRQKIWEWWQTTPRTRMEPGGSIIVDMARWDVDDLVGHLKAQRDEPWVIVELPAVAEANDAIGRSPGEALWPERYDLSALAAIRRDVGEDAWASLYQQRPNPQGRGYYFDVPSVHAFEADCREPIETRKGGLIRIYKRPVVAGRYVFGGDVAWGEKGAYSCVPFEDFQTGETVAELYGRPSLEEAALETVTLAKEYGGAWNGGAYGAVERNGEGEKVCKQMVALGYGGRMFWSDHEAKTPEKPGWQTTGQNRPTALAELEEDVRTRGFIPRCRDEVSEMLSFVRDEHGKPVPRPGTHSDHIMARMICRQMRKYATFGGGVKSVAVESGW